jgi:hypothetical protein
MFFGWNLIPHDDGNDGTIYKWQYEHWLTLRLIPIKLNGKQLPKWYVNLIMPVQKLYDKGPMY